MPDKTHSRKSKGIKRNDADSKKCVFPNCFVCPLPDCTCNKMFKSERQYLRRMDMFRNFRNSALNGTTEYNLQRQYPECTDNELTVSIKSIFESMERQRR